MMWEWGEWGVPRGFGLIFETKCLGEEYTTALVPTIWKLAHLRAAMIQGRPGRDMLTGGAGMTGGQRMGESERAAGAMWSMDG